MRFARELGGSHFALALPASCCLIERKRSSNPGLDFPSALCSCLILLGRSPGRWRQSADLFDRQISQSRQHRRHVITQ